MTLPALPQAFVDTAYPASTGKAWLVNAGGDLQGALNSAQPGDIVSLAAGATFTGPYTLPAKSGVGWVKVMSSSLASLPPEGTRVSPAQAGLMPKILGPSGGLALQAASGAHHFRFVGVEFSPAPGAGQHTLIRIGTDAGSVSALPHHIIFDRCYLHGTSQGATSRPKRVP